MFAGVGGEWLYRPWKSPVAFGVDVNRVRQRDFNQRFSFRNYSVNTGHASLYWDTGWNDVNAKVSVGQYLAGDRGVTLYISRRFGNGALVGAYATKTNVSSAQFGEGSFDKGVYVSVPFDAILPKSSSYFANFVWSPLTRDGGARLGRANPLMETTSARDPRAFLFGPPPQSTNMLTGEDRFSIPEGLEAGNMGSQSMLGDLGRTGLTLGRQLTDSASAPAWLGAAGAILTLSTFDKPIDRFAVQHQTKSWNSLAKVSNSLPIALGAGVGALALGLGNNFGGDTLQTTAWTSVKATGFALAGNALVRATVGRARPDSGLGNTSFSGFQSAALKSGFPSNHVAASFALVTPFAQQYSMPWLYGVAAASAFGRVQGRQHWLTDTVAGGVMGYAMGSLLLDQQRASRPSKVPRFLIGRSSIGAEWDFE